MGRNKLSAHDRIKNQFKKVEGYIMELKNGDAKSINKHLSTIRSKALRDLCLFGVHYLDDYLFMIRSPPKEVGEIFGFSERKVYDIIKVMRFLSVVEEVGERHNQLKLLKMAKQKNGK